MGFKQIQIPLTTFGKRHTGAPTIPKHVEIMMADRHSRDRNSNQYFSEDNMLDCTYMRRTETRFHDVRGQYLMHQ